MRDKAYLAWLRSTVCLICRAPFPEPHHCSPKGHGSIALKCPDRFCIPLCQGHHREFHQIGRDTFAKKYGIDYETVIERLQKIYQERTT